MNRELQPPSVGSQLCSELAELESQQKANINYWGENESVLAVSQHMLDLSEKTGTSAFINDYGREIGWPGRRFDFWTICGPACQTMVWQVATGQPWPRTMSLVTGKGR